MSDLLLIKQCKVNNRKAQLALYNKYCNGMYTVALRYINNTALAQDAVQEGFIKAFSKLEQYKGDVSFGAWLKKIVINTCLDMLKTSKRFVLEEPTVSLETTTQDNNWDVADTTLVEEVLQAINCLKDTQRMVLQLFLLEGYDHQEIASILNVTETASRTLLHRGKKQIQIQLKDKAYGTGY